MVTWTESNEAVIADQFWLKVEQERHQRLLHQLKAELRSVREQERSTLSSNLDVDTSSLKPSIVGDSPRKRIIQTPNRIHQPTSDTW
jgi:hypothetical protein